MARGRPLAHFQQFHVELDKAKHFDTDLFFNYLCLSEEMGELGSEFAKLWITESALKANGQPAAQARQTAVHKHRPALESELADCMAYLLKLANYAGIDLESTYLNKMQRNQARSWRESPKGTFTRMQRFLPAAQPSRSPPTRLTLPATSAILTWLSTELWTN